MTPREELRALAARVSQPLPSHEARHAAYQPRHAGGLYPDEARVLALHEPRHAAPVVPQRVAGRALDRWPAGITVGPLLRDPR